LRRLCLRFSLKGPISVSVPEPVGLSIDLAHDIPIRIADSLADFRPNGRPLGQPFDLPVDLADDIPVRNTDGLADFRSNGRPHSHTVRLAFRRPVVISIRFTVGQPLGLAVDLAHGIPIRITDGLADFRPNGEPLGQPFNLPVDLAHNIPVRITDGLTDLRANGGPLGQPFNLPVESTDSNPVRITDRLADSRSNGRPLSHTNRLPFKKPLVISIRVTVGHPQQYSYHVSVPLTLQCTHKIALHQPHAVLRKRRPFVLWGRLQLRWQPELQVPFEMQPLPDRYAVYLPHDVTVEHAILFSFNCSDFVDVDAECVAERISYGDTNRGPLVVSIGSSVGVPVLFAERLLGGTVWRPLGNAGGQAVLRRP
jgi:hypothetical protein